MGRLFFFCLQELIFTDSISIIFIAGITDYFDGYFARKYQAVSEIEILDPIADKILIVFLLFYTVSISSFYIAFAGSIIITREIWVGALRDFNARQSRSDATKVTFSKNKQPFNFLL